MPAREKLFGVDQEINLTRRATPTTIRKEHKRGKARLLRDSLGCVAEVELDDGTSVTFGISETEFKALGGA